MWCLLFAVVCAFAQAPVVGTWVFVGPPAGGVHPVDVVMANEVHWGLVALDGSVWITETAGGQWERVIDAPRGHASPDEALLAEVEARVAELVGTLVPLAGEPNVGEDDLEDLEGQLEVVQASQDAAEHIQSELEGDPWFLDGLASALPVEPRLVFEAGEWWVARFGELWRSSDGSRFERVRDSHGSWPDWRRPAPRPIRIGTERVFDVADIPGVGLVAATEGGARVNADPPSWSEPDPSVGGPCTRIASQGRRVVLGCASGLYMWDWTAAPSRRLDLPAFVSLATLIRAASRRSEFGTVAGLRGASALLPTVSASVAYRTQRGPHWDSDTWTRLQDVGEWIAALTLTWRPNRGSALGTLQRPTVSAMVLDGGIVVDHGGAPALLLSSVNRSRLRYDGELAQQVTALYRERWRLADTQPPVWGSLSESMEHLLLLAEVEAQLDVLTDSAVSRWNGAITEGER